MSKKIGALKAKLHTTPALDDHFVIEVSNTTKKEYFVADGDSLKLRISLDTAMQLAQYFDEELEDLLPISKKEGNS